MLTLLLGTGVYLMIRMRFLPLRRLGYALKCAVGKGEKAEEKGGVSPFSSLMTELAATIGTGNIVGVATAMTLGGAGALFWMLVSSFVGLATKFAESTLSVKYRIRNAKGEFCGGPMVTLARAFPNQPIGKLLATAFALFAILSSFGMGNMAQANSIAQALDESFGIPPVKSGLFISILTIIVVLGGIRMIAKVTQFLVPAMGVFYLLGAGIVIFMHLENIPSGLSMIFAMAFSPTAIAGGVSGSLIGSMTRGLRWGVARGVFSNEAGLGGSGISAAAANTTNPVRQGYISMTGVFFDTMIICTVTGLMLASSGVLGLRTQDGSLLTGTSLAITAFSTVFGSMGGKVVSIGIVLFAFATIIAWAYQGEKAFEFLVKKSGYCILYRFVYSFAGFVGTLWTLDAVWDFSDVMNAFMAIPNLICILVLSKTVCDDIRSYDQIHCKMK
jgi:AGCS family alanine or glycine:cation symporter